MRALSVSLIQGETRWLDAEANRRYWRDRVLALEAPGDLIVLPETFASGFTNDSLRAAEPADGPTLDWMRTLAIGTGAVVTGSLVIAEKGHHFNRLIWMRPDGSHAHYDKRHLFRMSGEHLHYAAGRRRTVQLLKGWRVLPLVCYDLRFPVWSRNRDDAAAEGGMDYDLLLYVANWPEPRREVWRTLLRARAIENLSYSVGVNRTGVDGNGHAYHGDSAVIDPRGEALAELGPVERSITVTLDAEVLLGHRRRFPAWRDADRFSLEP